MSFELTTKRKVHELCEHFGGVVVMAGSLPATGITTPSGAPTKKQHCVEQWTFHNWQQQVNCSNVLHALGPWHIIAETSQTCNSLLTITYKLGVRV